jgi:ABC-2 type transport system ATP-binding protein
MELSQGPSVGEPTMDDDGGPGVVRATAEEAFALRKNRSSVLTVRGVSKRYHAGPPWKRRGIDILDDLSLEVGHGELVGLVGENGSGKSTLMQIVVGMIGRDRGSVERPARLGYCPQQALLWDKLTVNEHFELFATAYEMPKDAGMRAANQMLEELQFTKYARFRVEQLSGGTRQKLNLALALMHDPELLLLDEPYSGFDWETYLRFWEMSERRRDAGMGILIVSHLLAERERLDRVYELRLGKAVLQ